MATQALPAEQITTRLLWLDLTRKCQLSCKHCFNESGPEGTHGTMSRADWAGVLDQAAAYGISDIQFIGGEPTMHPHFTELLDHALTIGLNVEVYSNLVHVSSECWKLFQRKGFSLATSYYAAQAEAHDAMTERRSHRLTRANIEKAVQLAVPLRVGITTNGSGRHADEALRDLAALGVDKARIRVDRIRPFGRGADGQAPDMAQLCGRCGSGKAAVSPTGEVSPCPMSAWLGVGNVKRAPLADILSGAEMARANAAIRIEAGKKDKGSGGGSSGGKGGKGGSGGSGGNGGGSGPCGPTEDECTPGFPGSSCSPRN